VAITVCDRHQIASEKPHSARFGRTNHHFDAQRLGSTALLVGLGEGTLPVNVCRFEPRAHAR